MNEGWNDKNSLGIFSNGLDITLEFGYLWRSMVPSDYGFKMAMSNQPNPLLFFFAALICD